MAGLIAAPALRRPTATGAVQQVHIIPGRAAKAAFTIEARLLLPIKRTTQMRGIRTWTREPRRRPRIRAFQTESK